MKLLCCHNRYQLRSGEDVAFDTAVLLWRDAGHDVRVFERSNVGLKEGGVRVLLRSARSAVYNSEVATELSSLIEDWRPDVAIIQNTFPLLSLAPYRVCAAQALPVIQVVYNYRFLCLNGELYTRGEICERCASGNYMHGVVRRCYRKNLAGSVVASRVASTNRRQGIWRDTVSRFVTPDRFLADKLIANGLPAERFRVIPNPPTVRREAGTTEHNGTLLFAGRWTRAKGVFTLLDAAMGEGIPQLSMIGGGEAEDDVRRHPAVRTGRVKLLGPMYGDDYDRQLRLTMAVVVPSEWYDNLPMVISQAFALGRPVIASRINGIPEYVHDGVNGLLVPPGDSHELRLAMGEIGRDPDRWLTLARGARATAERVLSEGRWSERWQDLFSEVV